MDDKGVAGAARAKSATVSEYYIHLKETVQRRPADIMDNKYSKLLEKPLESVRKRTPVNP
jgi:hypothetical protein